MKRTVLGLLVISAMLALHGCRIRGDSTLAGTQWLLTSLMGRPLIEGTQISLQFGDEWVSGVGACKAYGPNVDRAEEKYAARRDGTLIIPGFGVSRQECQEPPGVMEQDADYFEALMSSASYRIVDDRFEICNSAGQLILVFARKP